MALKYRYISILCRRPWHAGKERYPELFVFSEENPKEYLEIFSPGKDKKKENPKIPKRVSVDPLYESTDKYRRVVKPSKVDELLLPGPTSS
jgi:hypothetical protein